MQLQDWERTPAPWGAADWQGVSLKGNVYRDDDLAHLNDQANAIIAQCTAWMPFLVRLQHPPGFSGLGILDQIERWFAGFTDGELVAGREQKIRSYFEQYAQDADQPAWLAKWTIPNLVIVRRGLWMYHQWENHTLYRRGNDDIDANASVVGWQWTNYSDRKIAAARPYRHRPRPNRRVDGPEPVEPEPSVPGEYTMWVQATGGVNVRAHPSLHAPIREALPKGAEIRVTGAQESHDDISWLELSHDQGWIASHLLSAAYVQAAPTDVHAPIEVPALLLDVCPPELDVCVVAAIASIESGMRTKDLNGGQLQQRFEKGVYDGMGKRWAHDEDQRVAFSTSWGVGQIMGFHFAKFGYSTPRAFVRWLRQAPRHEWQSMIVFIRASASLERAVQHRDWDGIARVYNGAGYLAWAAKHGTMPYSDKLALAYQRVATPQRPVAPQRVLTGALDAVQVVRNLGRPQVTDGPGRKVARHALRESTQVVRPMAVLALLPLVFNIVCRGNTQCEDALRDLSPIVQAFLAPEDAAMARDIDDLRFPPDETPETPPETPAPTPTITAASTPAPTETSAPTPRPHVVLAQGYHLRSDPSKSSLWSFKLTQDTPATVIQREGEWVQIHAVFESSGTKNNVEGWVHAAGVSET